MDVQRCGGRMCAVVATGAGHDDDVVRYAATVSAAITQTGMVAGGLARVVTGGWMAHAYDVPPRATAAPQTWAVQAA